MSGLGTSGPFTIAVDPRNDHYDPDDEGWLDQVRTLRQDLGRHVDLVPPGPSAPGAKGTLDQIVIAMISAGALEAVVTCFRSWLERDRNRHIVIHWEAGGVAHAITLAGDKLDEEAIRSVAQAAIGQLGGTPWPAGTEPS